MKKIWLIFDIEKWLWKSEFCNFAGLITSTENVQKNFQCNFWNQWSIRTILKSFYQILLTWSKTYRLLDPVSKTNLMKFQFHQTKQCSFNPMCPTLFFSIGGLSSSGFTGLQQSFVCLDDTLQFRWSGLHRCFFPDEFPVWIAAFLALYFSWPKRDGTRIIQVIYYILNSVSSVVEI